MTSELICMKELKLTQGYIALVDDDDYPVLSLMAWHPLHDRCHGIIYARHTENYKYGGKRKVRTVLLHRFILGLKKGDPREADFINRNTLDCQKANLRFTDDLGQTQNRGKMVRAGKKLTSPYKGVSWNKRLRKFVAVIDANGKRMHLGCFVDELEAARAYDAAARRLHGQFACLNFAE